MEMQDNARRNGVEEQGLRECRKPEENFRECEDKCHTIVNSILSGVVLIDRTTHEIIDANDQALKIFGAAREDVIGSMCHRFICPAHEGACPVTDLGQAVDYSERIVLRADGLKIPVLKTVVPRQIDGRDVLVESFIDITAQKHAENTILASLKEKEILLKEIHHRVKNNLQIISSLLSLQSQFLKDREQSTIFNESRDRVRSMALIHEKLYQSSDFSQIEFSEYANSLIEGLFRSYSPLPGKIRCRVEGARAYLTVEEAVPCGLIINELVSNSFKYAFPGERTGEITIDIRQKPRLFSFTVSDNGVGLPPTFSPNNSPTLGLQLVSLLVQQLEGTLEIGSDSGASFHISFATKH